MVGIGSAISKSKSQKKAEKLQREQWELEKKLTALELKQQAGQLGVSILETESDISAYESFLARYPEYARFEEEKFKAEGEAEYRQLMENYGMINVLAGATGRAGAGTSFGEVGKQATEDVQRFAGEDMTLDKTGGLYGMGYQELMGNLQLEQEAATRQLDIYRTSLDTLLESRGEIEDVLAELEPRKRIKIGGLSHPGGLFSTDKGKKIELPNLPNFGLAVGSAMR